MPAQLTLSDAAQSLLRMRIEQGKDEVTPENLCCYRELAAAGIMYPVSGFVGGPESSFRFTEDGWARRHEFLSGSASLLPR